MAQPSATAAAAADTAATDIIDETLLLFRANCFFRNYEIQGGGDRVLIYLILFVSECLGKLGSMVRGDVAPGPQDGRTRCCVGGKVSCMHVVTRSWRMLIHLA